MILKTVYEWLVGRWNIVDKIVVPQVPPGDYIMSFRWDCEGTQQVWSSCSDVTITA